MATNEAEIKEAATHWLQQQPDVTMSELWQLIQYRTILPEPRYRGIQVKETIWNMILAGEISMNDQRRLNLKGEEN